MGNQIIQTRAEKQHYKSESGSAVLRTVHIFNMNFKQYKNICISVSFQWIIHLLLNTITENLLLFHLVSPKAAGFYQFICWNESHTNKSNKFFSRDLHNMQVFLFPLHFEGTDIRCHWFQSNLQTTNYALSCSGFLIFPLSFAFILTLLNFFYLKELGYHFGIQFKKYLSHIK